ncbi:MAG: GNAT family N-acetyltransferase [Bryobacteraceae bacterium]
MASLRIREAASSDDLEQVRRLFAAYAGSLGVSLCFQNFEQELAGLPGACAAPKGCLLLADFEGTAGGCVALRPMRDGACEMKRLFIAPEFRGSGAGRLLAQAIMAKAKALGYAAIRLDTLPFMAAAIQMYESLGFQHIDPYYDNPVPGALFLECKL